MPLNMNDTAERFWCVEAGTMANIAVDDDASEYVRRPVKKDVKFDFTEIRSVYLDKSSGEAVFMFARDTLVMIVPASNVLVVSTLEGE